MPHDWNLVVLASEEAVKISLDKNVNTALIGSLAGVVGTGAFILLFCFCTRKGNYKEEREHNLNHLDNYNRA